jgi:glyoxylase-like metal-dependent hydrolase (beta-lactamase superfamily II)
MSVDVKILKAGHCMHPERIMIEGGSWKPSAIPALFAAITMPSGDCILFDTGYSARFFSETAAFPFSIYARITPVCVNEHTGARGELARAGISPERVTHIVISHFHPDHIGGLQDFPSAKFICARSGYEAVRDKQGFPALRRGFLRGLVPDDFADRAMFIEDSPTVPLPPNMMPFESGYNLFNNTDMLIVDLPGHASGHVGLYVKSGTQSYFFIGDACWLSKTFEERKLPHPLARLIFTDMQEYSRTIDRLHELRTNNASIEIVPSHCVELWNRLQSKQRQAVT